MFAFSFVMIIVPIFAVWTERLTKLRIPDWFNFVCGLMLVIGFISLAFSLTFVMWKYLP